MTTTTRIRPCGEAALLLDCADLAAAVELAARLEQLRPPPVDVVAAAQTVLVTAEGASALPALRRRVEELLAEPAGRQSPRDSRQHSSRDSRLHSHRDPLPPGDIRYPNAGSEPVGGVADSGAAGREVVLDVRYDGPDLTAVADLAGVSPQALVRQHTSITWRAAFGGFAPGFFYLVDERELGSGGGDGYTGNGAGEQGRPGPRVPGLRGDGPPEPDLRVPDSLPAVPRLESPRARVTAGSVGMADRFCAVYPGASPGGWRLLGTTDAVLWDLTRPDPALLAPGVTVRFRDVTP